MSKQQIGLAIIAICITAALVPAIMYTAGWKLRDPASPTNAPDETAVTSPAWGNRLERVATGGLLIGGVIALGVASWRAWSADQQANAARDQVDTALQQVMTAQQQVRSAQRQADTAYQGLLNERYQKGAEMLGSDVLAVRLAGIYALGQLGRDHPAEYYVQVMKVLTAFVRHADPEQSPKVAEEDSTRVDVREAVAWIGANRDLAMEENAEYRIDLTGAYLRNANLIGADLSRTLLEKVNLTDAALWNVNFAGAHLWYARLEGAKLVMADLSGAELLNAKLSRAILGDAILIDANLTGADLSADAEWQDSSAATHLSGANLTRANLTGANLTGIWAPGADLTEANLLRANLSGVNLESSGNLVVTGLTQEQVDNAYWDGLHQPSFVNTLDGRTCKEIEPPKVIPPKEETL